jgi:hypothetical protein
VRPGQHTIQVYHNRGNRNNGNSRNRNNRKDVFYSSTVNVRPNYDVDVMINRFGRALVDERDLRYSDDGWNNNGTIMVVTETITAAMAMVVMETIMTITRQ